VAAGLVVTYQVGCERVTAEHLEGFFDGWPKSPTPESLLRVLQNSTLAVLAWNADHVVGFVNALSDGELAAYIPLLEVRRAYRNTGIGTELVRRVMEHFSDVYMIDAVCDEEVVPFYERLGMVRLNAMAHRNRTAEILS
jgi:ribosomal protein S18 acetylase RimI-like enzyme